MNEKWADLHYDFLPNNRIFQRSETCLFFTQATMRSSCLHNIQARNLVFSQKIGNVCQNLANSSFLFVRAPVSSLATEFCEESSYLHVWHEQNSVARKYFRNIWLQISHYFPQMWCRKMCICGKWSWKRDHKFSIPCVWNTTDGNAKPQKNRSSFTYRCGWKMSKFTLQFTSKLSILPEIRDMLVFHTSYNEIKLLAQHSSTELGVFARVYECMSKSCRLLFSIGESSSELISERISLREVILACLTRTKFGRKKIFPQNLAKNFSLFSTNLMYMWKIVSKTWPQIHYSVRVKNKTGVLTQEKET